MTEDDNILESDSFIDHDSNKSVEVNALLLFSIEAAVREFEGEPPTLEALAMEDENLLKIAREFGELFNQEGFVKYSKQNRTVLEKAIRTFIHQASILSKQMVAPISTNNLETSQSGRSTSPKILKESSKIAKDDFERLTRELLRSEQELAQKDEEIKKMRCNEAELTQSLRDLKEKKDILFQQKQELARERDEARRIADDMRISNKDFEERTSEKTSALIDQIGLNNFTIKRLEDQLTSVSEELANSNAYISTLKSKLSSKDKKIENLKKYFTDAQLQLKDSEAVIENNRLIQSELTQKIESMAKEIDDLSPEKIEAERNEYGKLLLGFKKLTSLCEQQAEEITELSKNQSKATDLIQHQNQLIIEYVQRLDSAAYERDQAVSQVLSYHEADNTQADMPQSINNISSDPKSPMRRGLDCTHSNTCNDQAEAYLQIKELLREQFGELTIPTVLTTIKSLLKSQKSEMGEDADNCVVTRLLNLIENQLRFIGKLAHSGDLETFLISSPNADTTLIEDQYYRDLILIEVARCKQYLSEINLTLDQEKQYDVPTPVQINQFIDAHKSKDYMTRESFNIATYAVQTAEVFRAFSSNISDNFNAFMEDIRSTFDLINFNGRLENYGSHLLSKLREFHQTSKYCFDSVGGGFDYDNFSDSNMFIRAYVRSSSLIRNALEKDLRAQIDLDCNVEDIPGRISSYIEDMRRKFDMIEITSVNDLRSQIRALSEELNLEKEQSTAELSRLEGEILNLREANNQLEEAKKSITEKLNDTKKELEETLKRKEEIENRFDLFNENYVKIEDDLERVRMENSSLLENLNEKKKQFDKRVSNLLEQERKQHDEVVQNMKNKHKEVEEKLREDLQNKSNKLSEAKKTLKELIKQYSDAFQKQKDATSALRQQNEALINKITDYNQRSKNPQKNNTAIEHLKSEIKSLAAEKKVLEAKLQQVIDKSQKAQLAKDNYWESQIALKQDELNKLLVSKEKVVNEEFMKYVSRLADALEAFAPRCFDGTPEQTEKLVLEVCKRLGEAQRSVAALQASRRQESPVKDKLDIEDLGNSVAMTRRLDDWEKWGRDTYVNITSHEAPGDVKLLRRKLADMAIASVSQRLLLKRIDSLHFQKYAMLNGALEAQRHGPLSARGFFCAVVALIRMQIQTSKKASILGGSTSQLKSLSRF